MKNILSPRNRSALNDVLRRHPILIFDFDGTLSPIVKNPHNARMRESTKRLLQRVAQKFPCAVVSGRKRDDVKRKMAGVRLISIIGNHGIETGARIVGGSLIRRRVKRWADELRSSLPPHGVHIEDKLYSLSVHYRAPAKKNRIVSSVEKLKEARIIGGKNVINILPRSAPDKGKAVLTLLQASGASHAVYVGDDVTDEYVFALSKDNAIATVRVGRSGNSRAQYYLSGQREMDGLLCSFL